MPLEIDNIDAQNESYFFQTIQDNASETPLPIQDTYEIVVGNRLEPQINNFIVEGTGLKYVGLIPIKLTVTGSTTWEAGGTLNAHYKIGIFKNGVSLGKVEGTLDNSNAWPRNVGFNAIVDLVTNDVIDIRTANEDNTQSVLIIDLLWNGVTI